MSTAFVQPVRVAGPAWPRRTALYAVALTVGAFCALVSISTGSTVHGTLLVFLFVCALCSGISSLWSP
jgi:hypothetical protein